MRSALFIFLFGGNPVSKPFKHYCMVARHAGLRDIASKKCPQTLRNARPMYSFTYVRTYVRTCVHVGNYARTYVGTYVAGCVSHAVLSRCKRNRIYVGMYYVCTYVKCFLRMDVFPFSAKQEQRNPT